MRDVHESCSHTEEGCLRCEVVPAATGKSGDTLLLAPLDCAAREALERILKSGRIDSRETRGMLEIDCGSAVSSSTVDWLKARLPSTLQDRIKGVFFDGALARTAESMLAIFIHAEPLSTLFDVLDVEWARTALLEDRLFSVYHPIVDARDGSTFAHEALIRARHPATGDVVGAQQLIYACERLNLHNALDQCARVTALKDARMLDFTKRKLFMNFLPSSIYEPEVCLRTTMAAAKECGVPLDRLVFEVIETEQISNMDGLRRVVEYYRKNGAGIALDDISSGFASLQYLADIMPDYAKIDRHLIASAGESDSARHTLDSLVGLARKLSVKVVAEGIETPHQMRVCQEAGVDYMQGFLFARPAAPPEAVRLPDSFHAVGEVVAA
jgi:EAL domain-containing protein (putative c-di-GMP-specific phosphodiesterase class I)